MKSFIKRLLVRYRGLRTPAFILIAAYAGMIIFFSIASPHYFAIKNFQSILVYLAVQGLVVVGAALVILAGNFDIFINYYASFVILSYRFYFSSFCI